MVYESEMTRLGNVGRSNESFEAAKAMARLLDAADCWQHRTADCRLSPATPEQSVVHLDQVREILLEEPLRLDMCRWHTTREWEARTCAEEAACGTAHCLAGWLQVISTDDRVRAIPAAEAGILMAPVAAKMFYRTDDDVLAWLEAREYVKELNLGDNHA